MRVLVGSGFRRFRREPHSRPPKEYQQHFQEWLRSQPSDVQRKFEGVDLFKDVVLELLENKNVENLYGRRPAGSNYGKEFEQVVTEKKATKGHRFQRGKRDPIAYTCSKIGATILRPRRRPACRSGRRRSRFSVVQKGLGEYLDMKVGKVETPGTKVNMLGRTKVRTHDALFMLPENKHRDNILTLLDLWHARP